MRRFFVLLAGAAMAFISLPASASDADLGEVRTFALQYCPEGWHATDGTLMSAQEYMALHSLLRNRFGGDDIRTFALPKIGAKLDDNGKPLMTCILVSGGNYPVRPDHH